MNDADAEFLLYRIFTGKLFFYYKNEKYELASPSVQIRYEAQLLYNNIINDEKYNDWLREENLERILISLGLWTMDTKTIIKSLEKKIDDTKVSLYNDRNLKDKTKINRKNLENYTKQLYSIFNKKSEMYSHTLEGYASSLKNEYIICKTLYKDGDRVFVEDSKNNQNSYTLFNNIVNEINNHVIEGSSFKMLGRNNIWRMYWNCNKNNVFPGCVSDWTFDQRTLVSISKMYDNVYDHPECPEDVVVEDDDMLDGWMIIQRRKIENQKKQHKLDSLNPKLQKAQEVFLIADNQEEASDIIGMNSPESLIKLKQRQEHLARVGSSSHLEMPDVQMDLRARSVDMARQQRRK